MRAFLIRRLLILLPVFAGILFLLFLISNLAPGDPTSTIMDPRMTAERRANLQRQMGLDRPLMVRFATWSGEALKGNLGYSSMYHKPVTEVIGTYLGKTFNLAIFALILSVIIGVPAGIISATKQYSAADHVMTVLALIGISIPGFFLGLLLLKFFAIDHMIFPLFGLNDHMLRNPTILQQILDRMYHLVLPTIVLGLGATAAFMRYTRSSMLEVIRQDYIRTARAKGLKERIVIYRHAFRNALIPIVTLLGFEIPVLISGAVITESIFSLPGVGRLAIDAVMQRDYNLFMGINAMVAFMTLIGNLVADILYAVVDPRVKYD
jgi:peptide/nickel transport system permease protein